MSTSTVTSTIGRLFMISGAGSFAPHLLEAGVDIHTIQRLLGHGHISTTTRYFQLTRHTEMGPGSPLDLLERLAPPPEG